MNEKRLIEIEEKIDQYWDQDYLEADTANAVAINAYALLREIRRLRKIIEDADLEASLRRYNSFDKINEILSKVNKDA